MKYFNNIDSFTSLKIQYRTLAITNHPDRGGSEQVMKEINTEYDELYKIWVNRLPEEMRPTDRTGAESRRRFYTQYGWEGSRYDGKLDTKDIARLVREYCKEQWNQWKFSVRCHFASMCAEIRIELKGGPIPAGTLKTDECSRKYGVQTSYRYHGTDDRIVPEAEVVMKDVVEYCMSYNYDDSDAMTDYFDVNFYLFEEVAGEEDWQEIHKTARIKSEPSTPSTTVSEPVKEADIEIIQYSEKSYAVFGDTKPIKDSIKTAGGKWNRFLKKGTETVAGWVIPTKNRSIEEIKSLILK